MAALIGSGEGAAQLARFNVSKDALYSTRTRQKGTGLPSKHALPALVLATLPAKQPGCELLHRPVSTFIPSPSAHAQVKGVKIKLAGKLLLIKALLYGGVGDQRKCLFCCCEDKRKQHHYQMALCQVYWLSAVAHTAFVGDHLKPSKIRAISASLICW